MSSRCPLSRLDVEKEATALGMVTRSKKTKVEDAQTPPSSPESSIDTPPPFQRATGTRTVSTSTVAALRGREIILPPELLARRQHAMTDNGADASPSRRPQDHEIPPARVIAALLAINPASTVRVKAFIEKKKSEAAKRNIFRLLDLPKELRTQIIHHLIHACNPIVNHRVGRMELIENESCLYRLESILLRAPALLLASKQIRLEVLHELVPVGLHSDSSTALTSSHGDRVSHAFQAAVDLLQRI